MAPATHEMLTFLFFCPLCPSRALSVSATAAESEWLCAYPHLDFSVFSFLCPCLAEFFSAWTACASMSLNLPESQVMHCFFTTWDMSPLNPFRKLFWDSGVLLIHCECCVRQSVEQDKGGRGIRVALGGRGSPRPDRPVLEDTEQSFVSPCLSLPIVFCPYFQLLSSTLHNFSSQV